MSNGTDPVRSGAGGDEMVVTETAKRMRAMRIRGTTTNPGAGKSAHYSDEWYTPPEIPAAVGPFDLDPCAGPMSHAARNIRRPDCGLAAEWSGKVWLNPPYSSVHEWLDKLIAHGDGIALVNARPETLWFQRAVLKATAVLWLRGRVDFQRPDRVATHPPVGSVLVAFGEHNADALHRAELRGAFMRVVGRAAAADGVLRKPRARNGAVPQISVLNNPPSSNTA